MAIGKSDYQILLELKSKQNISEVLTRHFQGLDRGNIDLFLSAYHEDALVELEDFHGSPGAYHEWIMSSPCQPALSSMHFVTNVSITIDEMTRTIAMCESYFQSVVRFQRGAEILDRIEYGRCPDHFECRTVKERCRLGDWKIANRTVIPCFDRIELVAEQAADCRKRDEISALNMAERTVLSHFKQRTMPVPFGPILVRGSHGFYNKS